jgi:pimeloyl-ACP methyl ester carboxylesterase
MNIILVHGAWADGSMWSKVIPILQDAGHRVIAVHLPLHSLIYVPMCLITGAHGQVPPTVTNF